MRDKAIGAAWVVLVSVAVWCALALAFLLLCAVKAPAAPVPPPPRELTAEMMAATWCYEYGTWANGVIAFNPDGTYAARHDLHSSAAYSGTWRVSGNTVTITEWTYSTATGERTGGPAEYRFEFKAADYPNLSGRCNGATDVKLSHPAR